MDIKNQIKAKILPTPINHHQATPKFYVSDIIIDPTIIGNSAYDDFNDKNLDNATFDKVSSLPAKSEHVTPKE